MCSYTNDLDKTEHSLGTSAAEEAIVGKLILAGWQKALDPVLILFAPDSSSLAAERREIPICHLGPSQEVCGE